MIHTVGKQQCRAVPLRWVARSRGPAPNFRREGSRQLLVAQLQKGCPTSVWSTPTATRWYLHRQRLYICGLKVYAPSLCILPKNARPLPTQELRTCDENFLGRALGRQKLCPASLVEKWRHQWRQLRCGQHLHQTGGISKCRFTKTFLPVNFLRNFA